jgi:hypothetical protein
MIKKIIAMFQKNRQPSSQLVESPVDWRRELSGSLNDVKLNLSGQTIGSGRDRGTNRV